MLEKPSGLRQNHGQHGLNVQLADDPGACNYCRVFAEPLLLKRLGLPGKHVDEKASIRAPRTSR
jgi:hypothetical protein